MRLTTWLMAASTLAVTSAYASDTRELGSHEHGIAALDIAVEGNTVKMIFAAPAADIVGFEYKPESAKDKAAVEEAVSRLSKPSTLFSFPAAAGCTTDAAAANQIFELEDEEHEGHDHDHAHDDHDDHDADSGHSEFHAEYVLTCNAPDQLANLKLDYFDEFANAREVRVQIVSSVGANAFKVTREAPSIDLQALF